MLPVTSFPPTLLVVPAPEEEALISSTLCELVYGLSRADDAVFSPQEATDLFGRPFLLEFLFDYDREKRAESYFETLLLRSPAGGIRLVLCFLSIIRSFHAVSSNLPTDGVHTPRKESSNTAHTRATAIQCFNNEPLFKRQVMIFHTTVLTINCVRN